MEIRYAKLNRMEMVNALVKINIILIKTFLKQYNTPIVYIIKQQL